MIQGNRKRGFIPYHAIEPLPAAPRGDLGTRYLPGAIRRAGGAKL